MKKKMKFLGWRKTFLSPNKNMLWQGYDHIAKCERKIVKFTDSGGFGILAEFDKPMIRASEMDKTLAYYHEHYYYPDDLDSE